MKDYAVRGNLTRIRQAMSLQRKGQSPVTDDWPTQKRPRG